MRNVISSSNVRSLIKALSLLFTCRKVASSGTSILTKISSSSSEYYPLIWSFYLKKIETIHDLSIYKLSPKRLKRSVKNLKRRKIDGIVMPTIWEDLLNLKLGTMWFWRFHHGKGYFDLETRVSWVQYLLDHLKSKSALEK